MQSSFVQEQELFTLWKSAEKSGILEGTKSSGSFVDLVCFRSCQGLGKQAFFCAF
jgi:hypothetical protein